MDEPALWVALAACLTSCYFSACNIALKTFSRTRLAEVLAQRGQAEQADVFDRLIPDLQLMTGALRTSLNLAVLLAMLVFCQRRLAGLDLTWQYALAFAVSAGLVSVFSVAIPFSWARYRREHLLAGARRPLLLLWKLTRPLTGFLRLFDPVVRRISGAEGAQDQHAPIADQVLSVVEDPRHAQAVDAEQKEMLEAVFELPTTTAGEIMTPRTDIVGLEIDASLDQVKKAVLDQGYSRVPVYRDNLDHIVGVFYAKDLLRFLRPDGSWDRIELSRVLREPFMVPESKPLRDLLNEFKVRKIHMAIVLDEYGGTAGLVTIEDIIEELVGEIQDEFERSEHGPTIRALDERTYDVDARVQIDRFVDELGLPMPEDRDYDTVGGFVFARLGHIPRPGEHFDHDSVRVTVTAAEPNRVTRVRVERLVEAAGSPREG